MSSSELIGSHVYSLQQLSTADQQYGAHHQIQTKQPMRTCTGLLCFSPGMTTSGKIGKYRCRAWKLVQEADVVNTDKKVKK